MVSRCPYDNNIMLQNHGWLCLCPVPVIRWAKLTRVRDPSYQGAACGRVTRGIRMRAKACAVPGPGPVRMLRNVRPRSTRQSHTGHKARCTTLGMRNPQPAKTCVAPWNSQLQRTVPFYHIKKVCIN